MDDSIEVRQEFYEFHREVREKYEALDSSDPKKSPLSFKI